jgi:hypothetical protein
MDLFHSKLIVTSLLSVVELARTNPLAYLEIHVLRVCNVFMVQAPVLQMLKLIRVTRRFEKNCPIFQK